MKKVLISLLFVLFGCQQENSGDASAQQASPEQSTYKILNGDLIPEEAYTNPDVLCPINSLITSESHIVQSYPESESKVQKTIDQLEAFCLLAKQKFPVSEMTNTEADSFLNALKEEQFVRDESVGMPSPNQEIPDYNYTVNMMIHRVANGVEVFYRRYGCGVTYVHSLIEISESGEITQTFIERWRQSYSC